MINLKKSYNKKLKIGLILFSLLLLISCLGVLYIHKTNSPSLNIMALRADAVPIFKLKPTYEYPNNLNNFNINTVTSSLKELGGQKSSLHISLAISDSQMKYDTIVENLTILHEIAPHMRLSLIPGATLDNKTYMEICRTIKAQLTASNLDSIELIYYPINNKDLTAYKDEEIANIGIIISNYDDLEQLDTLYKTFSDIKNLYVQDSISSYFDDPQTGSRAVYGIYHLLATDYPKINDIICPYLISPINKALGEKSNQLLVNDTAYNTIYTRLLNKPWITTKDIETSNTSPYVSLNTYDTLSGQVELLIPSNSELLTMHKDEDKNMKYLKYKLNEIILTPQAYYPYTLTLDTTAYPNGINRLKGLVYNAQNKIIKSPSIDLTIKNDNVTARAPHTTATYSVDQKPTYSKNYIPILMYHTIAETVAIEDQNSHVETAVFDAQIKALLDAGYTPINFYTLHSYLEGTGGLPEKPVLITMDDGYLNNYTIAYPIYQKYNIPATLFVSAYYMKDENTERHFGWNAAKEMEQSGLIDIMSHGYDHTPLSHLRLEDLSYHISISRGLLEQHLGARETFIVAYPQFRNNFLTRKILTSLGVDLQVTSLAKQGTVLQSSNLKRINIPNTMSPQDLIITLENLTN